MSDRPLAMPRRILLVGVTGMIGRQVVAAAPSVEGIMLQGLARREMQMPVGARFELMLAESGHWPDMVRMIAPEAVICALGTTRASAGSKEGFRAVDHDLVMAVAKAAKECGAHNFCAISAVGADANARNFYLKVKGETEGALRKLRFKRLDLLRPGLLRGERKGDVRLLERAAMLASPVTDLLMIGGARKYRSVEARVVAAAALQAAIAKAGGSFVHEHDAIRRLAARLFK